MSVATVQFFSQAIGKRTTYQVVLPDEEAGPFAVLMQLHGLSDDATAWLYRSNLARYVERLPLLAVLPDGGTSGYLNWRSGERLGKASYEDMLMRDLPAHVERFFRVRPGPWAIGGLSMGGYGAVRLGLKYPDRFCSIWGHSSAFHIGGLPDNGLLIDRADADVYAHAERIVRQDARPVVSFDCGVDDELIGHNRDFHAHLERIGLEHHYAEHPGAHTWDYWDTHVPTALRQHARALGIGPLD